MAKFISRNLTVTRVSYCVVEVQDKVPVIVLRTDAVFRGIIENRDRIMKLLKEREGKDANIIITDTKAGSNRYTISLENFVLNASIVEDVPDSADIGDDENDDDGPGGDEAVNETDGGSGKESPGEQDGDGEEVPNEQDGGSETDEPSNGEDGSTDGGEDSTDDPDDDSSGDGIPAAPAGTAEDHSGIDKASQPKPWY